MGWLNKQCYIIDIVVKLTDSVLFAFKVAFWCLDEMDIIHLSQLFGLF